MSTTSEQLASGTASFRQRHRGEIVQPGDDGYDAARAVWNGMIDRRPALIARCADTVDVAAAVRFAGEQGLGVAVRGGGHNAAGLAVADGALVVDLSAMNAVEVDPRQRTATAGGGTTWGVFDAATQAHGLATTGGAISTTGIAGLTLGGGIGWLMRSYGLACDNLIAAEVVTADGTIVTTSEAENPDLLWGLRGGGGNFGVVTKFTFRLHPVDTVLAGLIVHPIERAPEVLRFYRAYTASAPDSVTAFAGLLHTPDGMPVTAVIVCATGPLAEAEKALKPLREFGPPLADEVAPMPYAAVQQMLDAGFPSGLQVYWRSHFLTDLGDDAIAKLAAGYGQVTSPLSAVVVEHLGGAVARIDRNATAFDHRDAEYNLAIIARWPEPAMADAGIAWTRQLYDAMTPHARGVYVNYLGVGESQDRVRAAYGDEKYARLVDLKNRYDPTNVFRYNQNIKPSV
ncbi:MAG TPA: FAD-binding oxidoreductase [Thermomicrobiales bacterium]